MPLALISCASLVYPVSIPWNSVYLLYVFLNPFKTCPAFSDIKLPPDWRQSFNRNNMAPLTVNSKLRMNSGYEIPILGYGVGSPNSSKQPTCWSCKGLSNVRKQLYLAGYVLKIVSRPAHECEEVVAHSFKVGYRHVSDSFCRETLTLTVSGRFRSSVSQWSTLRNRNSEIWHPTRRHLLHEQDPC